MSSLTSIPTLIAGLPARRVEGAKGRPPILLLHGAFVTHQSFQYWQDGLAAADWGSVAFSYRGRLGIPPEKAAGLTIADYVADARNVAAELGETPILMGHSLGGLVAMKLLEAGLGRAAVLMSPAPAGMLTAQAVALPSYLPMLPSILAGRPFLPPAGTCSRIVLNRVPPEQHAAFHGSLVPESGKVYREMMAGGQRVDARKIAAPVMVIGGTEDRIISAGLMRRTAAALRGELRLLSGRGHLFFAEPGWEAALAEITAWLDRSVMQARQAA